MCPEMNKKAVYFVIVLLLIGEAAGIPEARIWFTSSSAVSSSAD